MEKIKVIEKAEEYALDVVSVRLVKDAPLYSKNPMDKPYEVVAALGDVMCEFDREVVGVINLKADLRPINVSFVSVGALNEAMFHPREVLKASILSNAASILLIHSHPSGNLIPSKSDTMVTDRMITLCNLLGIEMIDHVIVGGDNRQFFSFKEKGLIDNPGIKLATDYHNISFEQTMVAEKGRAR